MLIRRRGLVAVLSVFLFAASAKASSISPPPTTVRLTGHALPALREAKPLPSASGESNQKLVLTIILRRDHQADFDRHLRDIYDPHSKNFRKYLTQEQIADRFGPTQHEYDSVLDYLRHNGFRLLQGSRGRLTLTVSGTRAQAEHAFAIHVRDYRLGEKSFYAADQDPALPDTIAQSIQAIQGLSNLAAPRPVIQAALARPLCQAQAELQFLFTDECGYAHAKLSKYKECLTNAKITDFANDGYITGLQALIDATPGCKERQSAIGDPQPAAAAIDGTGQKIGLLEFDAFKKSDVANYLALIQYPDTTINNLSEVKVNGGASIGGYEAEVLLDINAVMTIVPSASVVVYDSPFQAPGVSFQTLFTRMMDDNDTVISNSWIYCENETNAADVKSIDSILATAAMNGISVLNATGDTGAACGSGNSAAVPADSPSATAVGGSTVILDSAAVYSSEKWWDSSSAAPPGGQGGFGASQFFSAPSYQAGLSGSAMRTVPDLVTFADPSEGVQLCQADAGGCPTGLIYGGTSNATPVLAAIVAELNQALGKNLGSLNPLLYPLANSNAFRNAATLGSDFAHVGLGSPNVDALALSLSGQKAGSADASQSLIGDAPFSVGGIPTAGPADGSTQVNLVVKLRDSKGHTVTGKTVTLAANSGSSAKISPASAVSDANSGAAEFTVTDLTAENAVMTATDTTDNVTLSQTVTIHFFTPPAAAAGLTANPTSAVPADGKTQAQITVTLQDALGRPTPGKMIQLSQTGSSVITGPNPPVTNSAGMIQFTSVDTNNETVTYSAVDVTDGNLPFPQTAMATFSNSATGCSSGTPVAAPGFAVVPVVTGFTSQNFGFGNINWGGCPGAFGPVFDSSGNMYVTDFVDGNLYKFPPTGGVAGPSTVLTQMPIGKTLAQPVFSNGNLYVIQGAGAAGGGAQVFQIDPNTGAIIKALPNSNSSTTLFCAPFLAADPLTGDLFTDDACVPSSGVVWRITNPASPSAALTVYTTTPSSPNANLAFIPSGTLYLQSSALDQISATNGPQPPTITPININPFNTGIAPVAPSSSATAQQLFANIQAPGSTNGKGATAIVDLTGAAPTVSTVFTADTLLGSFNSWNQLNFGPDGCLYGTGGNAIYKLTDAAGTCKYNAQLTSPTLVLNPPAIAPNPAQGTSQTFTVSFHNVAVPDGTSVTLQVVGANQTQLQSVTANNAASFSYVGINSGIDTLTAYALVSGAINFSNQAVVTWSSGQHVSYLSLNNSPERAMPGQTVTLASNLTDRSANPIVPISGQSLSLSLGGQTCSASTDSNGNASCQVTPSSSGSMTQTAKYTGSGIHNPTSASKGFIIVPPATAVATPTATLTPTPTPTPTPVPTPSPVPGKLRISPKKLNFGSVSLNTPKTKMVTITNLGHITKPNKKHPKPQPVPITIEMEAIGTQPSPFKIAMQCPANDPLAPASKGVKPGTCQVSVTFTPTTAGKQSGVLDIIDNLETTNPKTGSVQMVPLTGIGKAPK